MERAYYILRNNQQEGPFTHQEILQMALPSQTLLWSEGWTRWQPLAQVEELCLPNHETATPPSLPVDSIEHEPAKQYYLASHHKRCPR